jgi:hypothetical protein
MPDLNLEFGNAWEDSREWKEGDKNGWFVGNFPDNPIEGLRGNQKIEIKWYHHPKGHRADSKPTSGELTISILIEGAFSLWFRTAGKLDENWKQYILQNAGDYVIWGPKLDHKWEAIESSIVLTVRPAEVSEPPTSTPASPSESPSGGTNG